MKQPKTIKIDNVEYVQRDEYNKAEELDGMVYAIIRTFSAGCFAGYIKEREGKEGIIVNARRLYYWSGASTLSQLAMEGVKNTSDGQFPC